MIRRTMYKVELRSEIYQQPAWYAFLISVCIRTEPFVVESQISLLNEDRPMVNFLVSTAVIFLDALMMFCLAVAEMP